MMTVMATVFAEHFVLGTVEAFYTISFNPTFVLSLEMVNLRHREYAASQQDQIARLQCP